MIVLFWEVSFFSGVFVGSVPHTFAGIAVAHEISEATPPNLQMRQPVSDKGDITHVALSWLAKMITRIVTRE